MSIRISFHVRQRLEERAGVAMSDLDVLDLVPEQDQARVARGEDVVVRVPRLKLDLICTGRVIVSAIPSHRRNSVWTAPIADQADETFNWGRSLPGGRPVARTRQCRMDIGEEIVVGGRVRRIGA
jgi:hypothetical protein